MSSGYTQPDMVNRTLGQNLIERRGKESQTALAERAGVKQSQVSKWETGTTEPDTVNLIRLAKAFGVSLDELIKGIDPEYDKNISAARVKSGQRNAVEYASHSQRHTTRHEDSLLAALLRERDEYARVKAELKYVYQLLTVVVTRPEQLKGDRVSRRRKGRAGS